MARRLVFLAELAEQTARFEDMAMLMQTVAEEQHWLSSTERCLLSAAFKQLIGPRRAAVRLVDNPQVLRCEHAVFGAYLAEYRQQLVQDLEDWIHKLLTDAEAGRRKARKAFESALLELDGIPEDNYKEATLIMQLLRDAAQGPIWE
mmetsp:Transcript_16259/g.38410  ORF Transcript_16259/g.38410 Transcript_16259/m.38410 type:complete len:147 (+) Transcript_16259:34-474(+)